MKQYLLHRNFVRQEDNVGKLPNPMSAQSNYSDAIYQGFLLLLPLLEMNAEWFWAKDLSREEQRSTISLMRGIFLGSSVHIWRQLKETKPEVKTEGARVKRKCKGSEYLLGREGNVGL